MYSRQFGFAEFALHLNRFTEFPTRPVIKKRMSEFNRNMSTSDLFSYIHLLRTNILYSPRKFSRISPNFTTRTKPPVPHIIMPKATSLTNSLPPYDSDVSLPLI